MRAYETDSTSPFLYRRVAAHQITPIQITLNTQPPSATAHDASRMSVCPQGYFLRPRSLPRLRPRYIYEGASTTPISVSITPSPTSLPSLLPSPCISSLPSPLDSPPHQRVRRISDILPEEDPEEDPDEEPASAENPTINIPLGLGQRAAVLRQREFAADGIPSTFEIGQSSRTVQLHEPDGIRWRDIECNIRPTISTGSPTPSLVPNSPAAPAAPAPDIPTEAEDEDDDDNDAIEQIRARLEMHASAIDLHIDQLNDLVPSHFDEYERDVNRLNTRTGNMVRDLTTIQGRVYELQRDSMMARDAYQAIWQRLSALEVQNVTLQKLHQEDRMEIQSLKRHIVDLERAEKERRLQRAPKRKSTRNPRPQPAATTAPVRAATASPIVNQAMLDQLVNERVAAALAATSTTDADTSRPIGNNNQGCTYKEFCSCMTGGFNGTEGAVGLSHWLEKLETVFRICNYEDKAWVKYASFTLQDVALNWWNNYMKSAGIDTAYAMPWEHFKEMVLRKYCPRNEELALLCPEMVPTEVRLKKRYIKGLPSSIKGDVTASKTADLHETIEAANQLIDQVIEDTPKKVVEYKRKWDDHSRNNNENNHHNNPNKRHETARVYTAGSGERKEYAGNLPLCNRCKFHHTR
ncbi:hypothetical protein Tco_0209872 [Tanacetum coccineum]